MTIEDMHHAEPARNAGSEITPYVFDGRNIRLIDKDGETWFVATDVAGELGYTTAKDMTRLLDEDEKGRHTVPTLGGDQELTLVSEPGLYRAIIQRRANKHMDDRLQKRLARFQRWVFHDVLPSIRKTGSYSVTEAAPQFDVPRSLSAALRLAADQAETIEKQSALITVMQPKAEFHDTVADAINAQEVNRVAKLFGTGQNRFFKWLRDEGILMSNNVPYQQHVDAEHFRVVERSYKDKLGECHTYTRTLVTGKGLAYLQKRWTQRIDKAA